MKLSERVAQEFARLNLCIRRKAEQLQIAEDAMTLCANLRQCQDCIEALARIAKMRGE